MKRSEAARYARWSGAVAIAILVSATGVYLHRRLGERGGRGQAPPPVPANVEQQSAQFSYSKVVGNRTIFSIRASRATEYKDQNRSNLQEVLISIYGPNGDRNDAISAHECSYVPSTGQIQCQGAVQIDLRNARKQQKTGSGGMHLETRDISFDSANGNVSTPNEIVLRFPGGIGQATGANYDTKNEVVNFKSNVHLELSRSGSRPANPVSLAGSSLEYRRSTGWMRVLGPVTAQQGDAKIRMGTLEMLIDSAMIPEQVVASHRVRGNGKVARGIGLLTAKEVRAFLGADGSIERLTADGDVDGEKKALGVEQHFSAQHVDIATVNHGGRTEPHDLDASGDIQAEVQQYGMARRFVTASLHAEFAPRPNGRGVHVVAVNTSAPGEITVTKAKESDRIHAGKLAAEFNSRGQLAKLNGTGGVESLRQIGSKLPQVTSSQDLVATYDGANEWRTIAESGAVKFQQGDRTAMADHAVITRATNEIVLDGNAAINDATSSTSASHIEMNQASGEVHATGSVLSSNFGTEGARQLSLDSGAAHISADRLDSSNSGDTEIYSGKARLWQGDATLDAASIEVWRVEKKLEARGNVRAVIPDNSNGSRNSKMPVLWQVRAPKLDYWNESGGIDLAGGVQAQSAIGSLSGKTVEFLLVPGAQNKQYVQRATVDGNVRIEANGRLGTADRGEYTSVDGKFVLSGGQPTLSDALGNTTTGRQLTFFLANDTILVSSQEGSRTVTKHRVEK